MKWRDFIILAIASATAMGIFGALAGCEHGCPQHWKDCPKPDAAQAAVVTSCELPDAGQPDGEFIDPLGGAGLAQ